MYPETTQAVDQASDAIDEVTAIGRRFARMGQAHRNQLLERLVRIQQAESTKVPVGRLLEPDRVYHQESMGGEASAPSAAPRGITLENLERVFTYQSWASDQIRQAEPVKEAILALGRAILRNVPDCPDRSVALRKLRELRMDVNAAITHRGEF